MQTTRRNVLKGALAGAVVTVVPSHAIPGLTPIVTLERLAAEGKYLSVAHHLPHDHTQQDFTFFYNGKEIDKLRYFIEMYAPGDDTGWAVLYGKDHSDRQYDLEVIRGNWSFTSKPYR